MTVKELEYKVLFPAPFLAHWITGLVACCEKHANELVILGELMGSHIAITDNTNENDECSDCINKNK